MGLLDFLKNAGLLELQKRLAPNSPNKLVFSEKQLRQMANQQAKNSLRIIKDSSAILQNTTNPDVFFSRLDLCVRHIENLNFLKPWIKLKGVSPEILLRETNKQKYDITLNFLKRYYQTISEKAEGMKTPKGRDNQYKKFYETLKPYQSEMNQACLDYIESTLRLPE